MAKNDGDVIYTIRGDDSKLEADLADAEKKLKKSTEDTAEQTEQTEKKAASTQKKVKEEVTEYHKQQNAEREDSDKESHSKREGEEKAHGEKLKNIASGTAKAVGAGLLATGAAVAGIGVAGVNAANDMDKAMNQFAASTGVGTEETERYKKVMEEIYTNNYGENFEDIGVAMAEVTRQLGEMDDVSLQNVTESAFALRDTFGFEIPESTRAAKAMVDNFGIDGQKAMELIAAGAQNGLDYSGELLDSISEYSVQFEKVGLDADDMFKIFQKGAETGAFNLDKVGDAVKEFSIRAIDGSETTKAGFETIGMNADDMAAKFAAGGDTAKQAFQDTINALANMEDPLAQNTAGVALFGTMWEDLGPDAVSALADIEDGAYDTADAMGQIKDVKYDDIGSVFEGLKRSIEVLIIPLGEQLIPLVSELIEDVLPLLEEYLPPIIEQVAEFAKAMMPIVEEMLPPLLDTIQALAPVLVQIIEELLPPLLELISALAPIFADLISAVLPVLVDLINTLLPPLIEIISTLLPALLGALEPIVAFITTTLMPILRTLLDVFGDVFVGIVQNVSKQIERITTIFKNIVDFIKNVFTGNWKAAWENIKNIFSNIVGAFGDIFKLPINICIDLLNGFINGINSIRIPDWVPVIGGFSPNIPNIPRLKVGMDYVPMDDFPAYLHEGEAVLTKQENAMYRQIGGLQGMYAMLNNNQTTNSSMDIDYDRMGREYAKAMDGVGLNMDGQRVGQIVTPHADKNMGSTIDLKNRGAL